MDRDSLPYVYGYVPIVVAKCGMLLKETGSFLPSSVSSVSSSLTFLPSISATQTEGIFRVSGSTRRINELQAIFDAPPRYGKDLDWTGFSVHDAASVLRRFLNLLPVSVGAWELRLGKREMELIGWMDDVIIRNP